MRELGLPLIICGAILAGISLILGFVYQNKEYLKVLFRKLAKNKN